MIAMVLSVSAVLANSFAGQLLGDEDLNTTVSIEGDGAAADGAVADQAETS